MAIVAQLASAWDGSGRAQLALAWADEAPGLSITIDGDFERSCVDPALSSWAADYGDGVPVINIQPRRQTLRRSDGSYDTNQWLEPCARVTGVNGIRPWVTFQPFANPGDVTGANNQTWLTTQRAHYSYDGVTWQPFNAPVISTSELRFRPPAAFEQDVVYIARSWPRPVAQVGSLIAAIAAAHPTKVAPLPSAAAFSPVLTTSYPAQDYVFEEVGAKTNELGGAVPATPLYGFAIDDAAFSGPKKVAVMTAGVHASEDVGELWLWEMVDYVLNGSTTEAIYVRQNFRILVYPLINTSGRAGGYWRGSPDHEDDPNSEWYEAVPSHEFVPKVKSAIIYDVGGNPVAWAIDTHASRSGTRAQLGVRAALPSTVEYDSLVRARHPAGDWSDYESRSIPLDMTSGTVRTFLTRELQPGLSMLHEVCDRPGSVTPAVMRPYAEASIGALADMDAAGWFDPKVLVADPSSIAIAASDASLIYTRALRLVADPATYTLTASDASLTYTQARTLAADPSSFTITASDATLVHATPNRTLPADPASYAISSNDAALIRSRILSAAPSAHVVTSSDAARLRGRALQAEPVSHTIGAFDATLIYNTPHKVLVADASSITLSPAQAALEADRRLVAEPSTLTVTANHASMLRGRALPAEPTSYAITALDATLFIATTDRVLSAEPSAYTLASAPAALLWSGATTPYLNRSVFVRLGEQRPFARTQEPRIFTRVQ